MNNEASFNKEAFAILLNKAKGDRSINHYANEANVSAAHISRFLRELVDSPPTPETISKLAQKASNGVSYKDLMIAAGYISENSAVWNDSPRNRRILFKEMEKKFFQVILSELYTKPFEWSLQKPEGKMVFPDMVLSIDHDGYTRWYLEFKACLDNGRPYTPMMFAHNLYGRISMMELHPTDKFTIVLNNEKNYDQLLKRPPVSLRVNLYIMLIDLEKEKIMKEEKLCEY